jgi:hypothetical protein
MHARIHKVNARSEEEGVGVLPIFRSLSGLSLLPACIYVRASYLRTRLKLGLCGFGFRLPGAPRISAGPKTRVQLTGLVERKLSGVGRGEHRFMP